MLRIYLSVLFLSISTSFFAQEKLKKVTTFTKELKEVSGMHLDTTNKTLWAVNDSSNKNIIYGLDSNTLTVNSRIYPEYGPNVDWEDLAWDGEDTLFIGDFGNNKFKRHYFTIYSFSPKAVKGKSVAKLESIRVEFPDKAKKKGNISFDIEALIYLNGDLYMFTKTKRDKFKGITAVYCISAEPGIQQARYIGDISICGKEKNCKITGAAMHHASGTLALISHKNLYIINDFNGSLNFDKDQKTRYEFKKGTQKEGVTFVNATTVLISEEKTKGPNYLYTFSW